MIVHWTYIVSAGAAIGALVFFWFWQKKRVDRMTSHVVVEEDEELIEAELAQLEGLVAGLVQSKVSISANAQGEDTSKENVLDKVSTDMKDIKKKSSHQEPSTFKQELKKVLEKPVESNDSTSEESSFTKALRASKKSRQTDQGTLSLGNVSDADQQQETDMKKMIAQTEILVRENETKKAYVLYLRIQRTYETLPKKIQLRIHEQYSDLRSSINRTIPELEIIDESEGIFKEKSDEEKGDTLRKLLKKAEDALAVGERAKALILYSEIKGMFPLVPAAIRKEVHEQCVAIYKGCVGRG